ncbi:TetR family transcriptional regulator [Labedella gwakjiensis]|uniref:TetR family transcriptional regulator n=1 Tax=Labedella gwakjiensis TaxID=390269 RepID=A0A2P8GSI7_9MICO|nr:TetR/AcrR family transcriptional regulator [Labedella gwakjiensis]PSL36928.1 TetR family transcriptional regulator [Labedella gwakjiensis]RUQ81765.1 TetR/AcrR family transcriptional regulator [Labedella gwakjiensis]
MPTPERTSLDAIVTAASDLLEETGLVGVTMQAVADRVGVRPPSLYKRVENRERLIQLVAEATLTEVGRLTADAEGPADLANTMRAFGHRRPAAFQLVMTPSPGTPVAGDPFRVAASASILRVSRDLVGDTRALEAARTLTAWTAGFITMELGGSFRLGGDLEDAWRFGLERITAALASADDGESAAPRD